MLHHMVPHSRLVPQFRRRLAPGLSISVRTLATPHSLPLKHHKSRPENTALPTALFRIQGRLNWFATTALFRLVLRSPPSHSSLTSLHGGNVICLFSENIFLPTAWPSILINCSDFISNSCVSRVLIAMCILLRLELLEPNLFFFQPGK